jgi:hypothetical protein
MFSITKIFTRARMFRTNIIDKVKYKLDTSNFTLEI